MGMTTYAGRKVPQPKFEIGDYVSLAGAGLKAMCGRIGHVSYRDAEGATTGWFYKIHLQGGGYQSWAEKYLRKLTKAGYEKKMREFEKSKREFAKKKGWKIHA